MGRWTDRWIATTRTSRREEKDIGKLGGREKGAKTGECEKKGENLCRRADKEDRGKDRECYSGRAGEGAAGERGGEEARG